MAVNKITLVVDFQSASAQQNIEQLNSAIGQIGSASTKASTEATQGIQKVTVGIEEATQAADKFSQALIGLGIGKAIQEMVSMGAELQRIQTAMNQTPGGGKLFEEISRLAQQTGFDLIELEKHANELRNTGIPIERVGTYLRVFADAAAKAGTGMEGLTTALSAAKNIAAGDFVNFKSLVAFRNIGLQPTQEAAKALNLTIQELRTQGKQLSAEGVLGLVLDVAQKQAGGAGAALAKQQISAQFGILKSEIEKLGLDIVKAFGPSMITLMQYAKMFVESIREIVAALGNLPQSVKTLALGLTALAIAMGAFVSAYALFAKLPAMSAIFTAAGTAIQALVFQTNAESAALTTLGGTASATAIEVTGLTAAFVALGKSILIIAAFKLGYDVGTWLRELATGEEAAIKKTQELQHEQLAFIAKMREQRATAITGADQQKAAGRTRPFEAYSTEELTAFITKYTDAINIAQMKKKQVMDENIKQQQHEAEVGANLLSEAYKRSELAGKESIAALTYTYQEHYRQVQHSAAGLRDAQKAYAVDVATEVKKRQEEVEKQHEKAVQEEIALLRKVQIAQASVVPDETFSGRRQKAQEAAQDETQQFIEQARERIKISQDYTDKQIAATRTAQHLSDQQRADAIKGLEAANAQVAVDEWTKATLKIQYQELHAAEETNRLIQQQRQQDREERLADELDFIQKRTSLEIQYLRAEQKQTLPERLKQIQDVSDLQETALQQTRDAQLTAAKEGFDEYVSSHKDATLGIAEEERKLGRTRVMIEREYNQQLQSDRLESWRETNDQIIEEQRKVYDSLKSAADKVFDAMTGKAKDMWHALGNAAKEAITGTIKEFVTSRAAGELTGAITGRGVTFPGGFRGFGGHAPAFEGAGSPPVLQKLTEEVTVGIRTGATELVSSAQALTAAAAALSGAAGALVSSAAQAGASPTAIQNAVQTVRSANNTVALQGLNNQVQTQMASGGGVFGSGVAGVVASGGSVSDLASADLLTRATGGGNFGATPYGAMPPEMGTYQPDPGLLARATGGGSFGAIPSAVPRATLGKLFGIGQPVTLRSGTQIPWTSASPLQKFGAILQSQGAAQMGLSLGSALALSGLGRNTPGGRAQTIAGATMAGLSAARMFPALFNAGDLGPAASAGAGAALGLGVGVAAAGLQRGGLLGLGMSVGGGALAGAALGTAVFPVIGTALGAAIGAGVGAIAGGIRLLFPTLKERIPRELKRVYGVDIKNQAIISQIADIITQKYGGNLSTGVYSQDVQEVVRLYALSTGQSQAGLPRQMYSATFAQSQAGGLQVQPVYSGGQLIQNPYVGTTNTQLQNALFTNPAVYMQLHPQQAADLFAGQVVKVMGNNPGSVAAANTSAARNGISRTTQASALMEPLTVTR